MIRAEHAHYTLFCLFFQDLLVHSKGGFLCARLKYYRYQLSRSLPFEDDTDAVQTGVLQQEIEFERLEEVTSEMVDLRVNVDAAIAIEVAAESDVNESHRNEVRILKSLVVCHENMHVIKDKLTQTLDYRTKLVKDKELYFRVEFPYFFSNPDLVRTPNSLRSHFSHHLACLFMFPVCVYVLCPTIRGSHCRYEKIQNDPPTIEALVDAIFSENLDSSSSPRTKFKKKLRGVTLQVIS